MGAKSSSSSHSNRPTACQTVIKTVQLKLYCKRRATQVRRVSSAKTCERNFKQETVLSGRETQRERGWWGSGEKGKGESHDGNHFTPWQTISKRSQMEGQTETINRTAATKATVAPTEAPATPRCRQTGRQRTVYKVNNNTLNHLRAEEKGDGEREEFIMQLKIMKWHRAKKEKTSRQRQQKSLAEDALAWHSAHTHTTHTHMPKLLCCQEMQQSCRCLGRASCGKRRRSCLPHVKYLTLGFALHLFATHMEIKCLRLLWQQGSGKRGEQAELSAQCRKKNKAHKSRMQSAFIQAANAAANHVAK